MSRSSALPRLFLALLMGGGLLATVTPAPAADAPPPPAPSAPAAESPAAPPPPAPAPAAPAETTAPVPAAEPEDFHYQAANKRDPFRPPTDMLRQQARADEPAATEDSDQPPPPPKREKEPLEAFPLESLKLTGVIHIRGAKVALVQDPSGRGHPVQPGIRMGVREGVVVRITDEGIELEEVYIEVGEESPRPHVTLLPLHSNKGETPR
ncbi:MAG: pilus assembly protein PilP [Magnetococcales bacterium]|nr:pilus assembly protein PilP [Magnetococcales bacterium]